MVKIAICDDESQFLAFAQKIVLSAAKSIGLLCEISTFQSSHVLLAEIEENVHRFDAYIVDMEMPHVHGFELVKQINHLAPEKPIVILTSHMDFSIDAYEYNVLRYIPKQQIEKRIKSALKSILDELKQYNFFIIQTERETRKIYYHELIYIDKQKKYCLLHMIDDTIYAVRTTLENIYGELDHTVFCLIHRGCIVNLSYVRNMLGDSVALEYQGKKLDLPVGPKHMKDVREMINNYIVDRI